MGQMNSKEEKAAAIACETIISSSYTYKPIRIYRARVLYNTMNLHKCNVCKNDIYFRPRFTRRGNHFQKMNPDGTEHVHDMDMFANSGMAD